MQYSTLDEFNKNYIKLKEQKSTNKSRSLCFVKKKFNTHIESFTLTNLAANATSNIKHNTDNQSSCS